MIDDLERIDNERFGETSGRGTAATGRHQRAVMFTPRDAADEIAFTAS